MCMFAIEIRAVQPIKTIGVIKSRAKRAICPSMVHIMGHFILNFQHVMVLYLCVYFMYTQCQV